MSSKRQAIAHNQTTEPQGLRERATALSSDRSPLPPVITLDERVSQLPAHPTARGLRQAAVAQMQQRHGNAHVQRKLGPPTATAVMRRATPGGLAEPAGDTEAQSQPTTDLAIRPAPAAAPPSPPPNGNGNGHPLLHPAPPGRIQREEEEDDTPTEEEKAIARAKAAEAQRNAGQTRQEGQAETDQTRGKAETEAAAGRAGKEKAAAEREATPPPQDKEAADKPAPASRGPAGGAAEDEAPPRPAPAAPVAAVAEEGRAPASPQDDPSFQSVACAIKGAAAREKAHGPAATKAAAAQAAAEMPAAEIAGRAQANQTTKMEQAEAPPFDAAGLRARLMQRIQELAPKTAEQADEFKKDNKLSGVQGEMRGQVSSAKDKTQGPTATATREAPDLAAVPPKPVAPLAANAPGPAAPDVGAAAASPKTRTKAEIEASLEAESKGLDQQMAEADITPEQLARGNEPEFQAALDAKAEAQTHAATAPGPFRQGEREQLSQAEAGAAAVAQDKVQAMHADRAQLLAQVDTKQQKGKSADEKARQDVGANVQRLYGETKTKVEAILNNLDREVGDIFTPGAEAAKQAFESYIDAKMEAYKEDRYGGWFGWARWLKDKAAGMPKAVNAFYGEGRKLFLEQMDAVINNVVALIGRRLAEAKAEIAAGKKRIQEYVNGLPEALQSVGQQATEEIDGRFDELEADVNSKQDQLIDSLAQQYQKTLQAVDARIEELKAANRGLAEKAYDAVAGVAKAIWRLKDLLFEVLARVAEVVGLIIGDPIGFLENMIAGVKQGFNNFVERIGTYLEKGVMTWLFGEVAKGGINLPENFEPANVFDLALQVLGITADNVRARAVKMFGEDVVAALEQSFDMFMLLKEQGLAGLWGFVQEQLGNLKDTFIEGIKSMIATEVIEAGVKWLLGLLGGPVGAFIKACKAIYDIVMWFMNNADRLKDLIDAVLEGIAAAAKGSVDGMAKRIEDALASAVPVVIGFLASLLGLSDLGAKIRRVVDRVQTPVNKAVDWVLGKAQAAARRLGRMVGVGQEPVAMGGPAGAPAVAGGPTAVAGAGEPVVAAGAAGKPFATGGTEAAGNPALQAGLAAIHSHEAAQADQGGISHKEAVRIAGTVKRDHPVFQSISVVDGGGKWDYDYVIARTIEPGSKPKEGGVKGIDPEVDEGVEKAFAEGQVTSGQPLKFLSDGTATRGRQQLGVSGEDVQSTHSTAQSAMREVTNYDPKAALTRLLHKNVHRLMDQHWKREARRLANTGHTTWTAQKMFDTIAESIRRTPTVPNPLDALEPGTKEYEEFDMLAESVRRTTGLTQGEKDSLIARLSDEIFVEYGLSPTSLVRLPYSK